MSRARLALTAALLLVTAAARAQSSDPSVNCGLSITPLDFGRYAPSSTLPGDVTTSITVTCTTLHEAAVTMVGTVALNSGGGTVGTRQLAGPIPLRYQLYTEPTRTVIWGDGSAGSATVPVTGSLSRSRPLMTVLTVYGRLLARQSNARVGAYADQVQAIINY